MVEVISAPCAVRSTCLMVSTAGRPTIAAPCCDDGVDGAIDGGRVDQRAHRVVHQDDIVGLGRNGSQRMDHRLLPVVAALHHVDAVGEPVFGHLGLHALHLRSCAPPRRLR